MGKVDPYAQDGVDVNEGDKFSAVAGGVCRRTYGNSPFIKVQDFSQGNFRGPRGFTLQNLPDGCSLTVTPDGSGTKTILTSVAMTHRQGARDVVAMTCGDISRWGGLPLAFSNDLSVSTLGEEGDPTNQAFRELLLGLEDVARELGIVVLNGETAELGVCVSSEDIRAITKFNWSGFAIGVYHPDKMIIGKTLAAGQVVMALLEHGFRSNGISLVRKAFRIEFGDDWWSNPEAFEAIKAAAVPSILYDNLLADANGWSNESFTTKIRMHLIVHVTGGAIVSKFAKDLLFPLGLSARLDNLFAPPDIMRLCGIWRDLNDKQFYKTLNGGQGALVVVDENDVEPFIQLAQSHGITAQRCGQITATEKGAEPKLTIVSKFRHEGEEVPCTAQDQD